VYRKLTVLKKKKTANMVIRAATRVSPSRQQIVAATALATATPPKITTARAHRSRIRRVAWASL
jgi:hypothetical protein